MEGGLSSSGKGDYFEGITFGEWGCLVFRFKKSGFVVLDDDWFFS